MAAVLKAARPSCATCPCGHNDRMNRLCVPSSLQQHTAVLGTRLTVFGAAMISSGYSGTFTLTVVASSMQAGRRQLGLPSSLLATTGAYRTGATARDPPLARPSS